MARTPLSSPSSGSATRAEQILRLYSRANCHLCDEMAQALRGLGIEFAEIDVDTDPALAARYGACVPVLADDADREICRTRLDAPALRVRLAIE